MFLNNNFQFLNTYIERALGHHKRKLYCNLQASNSQARKPTKADPNKLLKKKK